MLFKCQLAKLKNCWYKSITKSINIYKSSKAGLSSKAMSSLKEFSTIEKFDPNSIKIVDCY